MLDCYVEAMHADEAHSRGCTALTQQLPTRTHMQEMKTAVPKWRIVTMLRYCWQRKSIERIVRTVCMPILPLDSSQLGRILSQLRSKRAYFHETRCINSTHSYPCLIHLVWFANSFGKDLGCVSNSSRVQNMSNKNRARTFAYFGSTNKPSASTSSFPGSAVSPSNSILPFTQTFLPWTFVISAFSTTYAPAGAGLR